jgi:DNA repair photolyase
MCSYCFNARYPRSNSYFGIPEPRPHLIKLLEKQLSKQKIDKQVLLSFIGDPYGPPNEIHGMTRKVLSILHNHNVPVAILTKGGTRCLKDIDIFKSFDGRIKVGASLTFIEEKDSLKWEPGAALPMNRFEALKELHRKGIKTFSSLEPVIDPNQTLQIIHETSDFVDHYKVGKVNHFKDYENQVDWEKFLVDVVTLLRRLRKPFYIKHSLQIFNRSIKFEPQETDQNFLNVRPWLTS